MAGIGLWRIDHGVPAKLAHTGVSLEAQLEDWIEHDPSMLERGLVIVGRQLRTESGPLDLLALDPQGRWVLIEIKRDRLRREVVAQTIDYAACLKQFDPDTLRARCDSYLKQHGGGTLNALLDERGRSLDDDDTMELVIYLVGTSMDRGLERMVDYLGAEANRVIRVVTFSVFQDSEDRMLLAREIFEDEGQPAKTLSQSSAGYDLDTLKSQARDNGLSEAFEILVKAGLEAGLYPRLWKTSVMFTPPSNRTRCLFTIWTGRRKRPGDAHVYVWPEAFEQFMKVPQSSVVKALGSEYIELDAESARRFSKNLAQLLDNNGGVDG